MSVVYDNDEMWSVEGVRSEVVKYTVGPFVEYEAHHSYYDTYPILKLVFPPSVETIAHLIDGQIHFFGKMFTLSIPMVSGVANGILYFRLERIDHKGKSVIVVVDGTFVQGKLEGAYSINILYDFKTIIKINANFVNGLVHGRVHYVNEAAVKITNYRHGSVSDYKFEYMWRHGVIPDFLLDLSQISHGNLFVYNDVLQLYRYSEFRASKEFVYASDVIMSDNFNDYKYIKIIDTMPVPQIGNKVHNRIVYKLGDTTRNIPEYILSEEIFNGETQEVYTKYIYYSPSKLTESTSHGDGSYNGLYQRFGLSPTMAVPLLPTKGQMVREFWVDDKQYYIRYLPNGDIEHINQGQIGKETITTYFDERGNIQRKLYLCH